MPKSKKINKLKNKTHKIKKYNNFRRIKKGGFAWSDITNWNPDFTNWKTKFTEKIKNFNIFKKKNSQLTEQLPVSNISSSDAEYSSNKNDIQLTEQLPVSNISSSDSEYSPNKNDIQINNSENNILPSDNNILPSDNILPKNNNDDFSLNVQKNENSQSHSTNSNLYGGYRSSHSLTNLASRSAPFWQPTAKAQVWVGGKRIKKHTKKHTKKNKKSYKKRR